MDDIKLIAEAQRRANMAPGDKGKADALRLLRFAQMQGMDQGHFVAAACIAIGTILTDFIRNGLDEQTAVDNITRTIEGFVEREH